MVVLDLLRGFFKKKRVLKASFYDEAGRVVVRKVKYQNNTFTQKFNGELQTYIVDDAYINYDAKTNQPMSSYYINNPQPIRFLHERNNEVDSIGFKKIIDSKVIKDLFSDEDSTKMLLLIILICISIAVSAFTLAKVMGWIR